MSLVRKPCGEINLRNWIWALFWMNLIDGVSTYIGAEMEVIEEINPFCNLLLQNSTVFLLVKVGLVSLFLLSLYERLPDRYECLPIWGRVPLQVVTFLYLSVLSLQLMNWIFIIHDLAAS